MSSAAYQTVWLQANQHLAELKNYENPKEAILAPKDREGSFQHLATLYIKYIQIFRNLETVFDQITHPQKRRLVKETLIACMGRMIEIKQHMVKTEMSDFHHFNDILIDLKLTHADLSIPIPRYFLEERGATFEAQKQMLTSLQASEFPFSLRPGPCFPPLTFEQAVSIIQVNERGRQGKLRAKYMRHVKAQARLEKDLDEGEEVAKSTAAAITIQRVMRGHLGRRKFRAIFEEDLCFYGLLDVHSFPTTQRNIATENEKRRKEIQAQHEEEYQQALVSTKEKIFKVESADMREQMQDSFRQWYMEYKRINGKFPEFPEDDTWKKPDFQFPANGAAAAPAEGLRSPTAATAVSESGKKTSAASASNSGDANEADAFNFSSSPFLEKLGGLLKTFEAEWKSKDELENFSQKHDQNIIKNDKRKEVMQELKLEVFEVLKEELTNLKIAVEKDKGGKKGKAGKKGKKDKKGKKGKKEKDLTANRTMESLIEELVQSGLMQRYKPVRLSDFKGQFAYLKDSASTDPVIQPSLAELARLVTEYCVLPICLSSEESASVSPFTSFCLFGPPGSGKTMLVNAIATEAGAHIFNITPRNTEGQFLGKANVTKMIHMVFKVAKAHAPSIIYVDDVEMVFAKKVPKEDTSDPKRIKKDLLKNMKSLKPEDRVIVIGNSRKPWDGDTKAMYPVFEKWIPIAKPDYDSRIAIWKYKIALETNEDFRNIDMSSLSKISAGFTAGDICLAVDRVLTPRRAKLLSVKPLLSEELTNYLYSLPPIDATLDELFKEFYEKIPLAKKRSSLFAKSEEVEEGKKDGKNKK